MKIVIAPDSFKGCQSSIDVANCIETGIRRVYPDACAVKIDKIPIADGGEGSVAAMVTAVGGEYIKKMVKDPFGRDIEAEYGVLKSGEVIIEMAAASGLTLIGESERNPLAASTYGTGQLILDALHRGYKKIIVGLGGSATNDGGAGMARALGVSFKDADGNELGFGGGELCCLADVDLSGLDRMVKNAEIIIASDVTSPLCGEKGASLVFAPQKGASAEMCGVLDRTLYHFADVVSRAVGIDFSETPGSGAAGGLGYGLMAFCNAKLKPGIEIIMDTIDINSRLRGADLVITGEGRIDVQSMMGKAPVGIARRAKRFGIPVAAIVGSAGEGAEAVYEHGIDWIVQASNSSITLEEAFANSAGNIADAAENFIRDFCLRA